jgi:hypothetical protein
VLAKTICRAVRAGFRYLPRNLCDDDHTRIEDEAIEAIEAFVP